MTKELSAKPRLTLHIQQETLFCEEFRIDQRNFGKRLLMRFIDAGVQSFAFNQGITLEELFTLLAILCDSRNCATAEQIAATLTQKNATHISLNTIRYQKVMDGQVVVTESMAKIVQTLAPGIDVEADTETLRRLASAAPQPDSKLASSIAERVKEMRTAIGAKVQTQAASSDELVAALAALNKDISRQLRLERAGGVINKISEETLSDTEKLTMDTLVKIVRDEYQQGAISTKRLAQIVRRLLPDVMDLKRLLPRLKAGLLAAGMNEEDYLKLMEELAHGLEQEGLSDLLRQASENAGISVDEVVQNIKKNPETTVNLILLSNEIQSMMGLDSAQVQSLMGEYFERITNEVLLSGNQNEHSRQFSAIKNALAGVQEGLLKSMAKDGADAQLIETIGIQLAGKIDTEIARLKMQGPDSASPVHTPDSVANTIGKSPEPTASAPDTGAGKKTNDAPKGVLGFKGIKVFLDCEIKRSKRYKTDLSCLCISALVPDAQGYREPTPQVLNAIVQQICERMSMTLRDLDLIGSLGSLDDNVLLVILSMTAAEGAMVVRKRLGTLFESIQVTVDSNQITPLVIVSAHAFDKNVTQELGAYIRQMVNLQKQEISKYTNHL